MFDKPTLYLETIGNDNEDVMMYIEYNFCICERYAYICTTKEISNKKVQSNNDKSKGFHFILSKML